MATTIYFNGRVTSIPGSYSEVDASGLATVNLGASGIVAVIGEAEGGKPETVYNTTNPGKVTKLFKAGDLREAGQILFDPSKDPDIAGGAQEVKFIKVNPATQSSLTLVDDNGDNSLILRSADYGDFNNKLQVQVANGTDGGKKVEVSDGTDSEVFDNVGDVPACKIGYAGDFTATVSFDKDSGLTAEGSHTTSGGTDYIGTVTVTRNADNYVGRANVSVVSTDGQDDGKTVKVWGIAGGQFAEVEVTLENGNAPTAQSNGNDFTEVFAIQASEALIGEVGLADDQAESWGVGIGVGATDGGLTVFTGDGIELDEVATVSLLSEAGETGKVAVFGTNEAGQSQASIVTLNEANSVATVSTFGKITAVGIAQLGANKGVTLKGRLLNSGSQVVIVSSDAGDNTQTATVYGLDANGSPQSEGLALNGQNGVTSVSTWSAVHGIKLSAAAAGTVTLDASDDSVKIFSLSQGELSQGLDLQSLPASMPAQNVAWASAANDGKILIIGEAAGQAALELVDVGAAASGTTTTQFTQITAVAVGHFKAGTVQLTAQLIDLPVASYGTLKEWSNYFDTVGDWSFTSDEPNMAGTSVATIDKTTALPAGAGQSAASLSRVLSAIVEVLNQGSTYVTAEAVGELPPTNTANPLKLQGAVEGTTLFSHWQAALDQLRDYRVNTIVALTSDPAVQAAVISHCNYMCGPGRSERDAFLGAPSGTNLADAKALAITMNTRHARLFIQDVSRFNTAGQLERMAPPFTACVAAGMQAGSDVGTSLTFKYLNIVETFEDSSYTIKDDAHELIQGGLCMIEKVPGIGYRWLRNVTTHLIDNNLAYIEGSVNEAVNYAVYNFRTQLEAMVGRKGFSGTVTATASIAVGVLGQLVNLGAITKYQNLTIELSNDVMTIDVEIAPVIPVNFIKSTIHLVSNSFSA